MSERRRPWPLVVRRARAEDAEPVLAFASNTWDGWDYMPHAFGRWLDAPDGVLLVGEVGSAPDGGELLDADGTHLEPGKVVAIVRVALPAAGEAWLEGIRVDPRVRGMDVATDLQVAELQWAAAMGARIVRYATSARNEGSHRLGARGGFEQIVELLGTWWEPPDDGDDNHGGHAESGFIPEVQTAAQERRNALLAALEDEGAIASDDYADVLWRLISNDAAFNEAARLYEPRPWALEELTEKKFRQHMSGGEVVTHRTSEGREALAILVRFVPPAEEAQTRLAALAGDPNAAFALVERIRELAGEPIRIRFPIGAPLVEEARPLYEGAGYRFWEFALHILARPLDDAHPPPVLDLAALILEDDPQLAAI